MNDSVLTILGGFGGLLIGMFLICLRWEIADYREAKRWDRFYKQYKVALPEWSQEIIESN